MIRGGVTTDDLTPDQRALMDARASLPVVQPVIAEIGDALCKQCGAGPLMFSARQISDGLCHPCGHKLAGKLQEEIERLRRIVGCVVRNCNQLDDTQMVTDACETGHVDDVCLLSGPTWGKVAYFCGLGSTSATALCREFGVDPHHDRGRQIELETEQ